MKYSELILRTKQHIPPEQWPEWEEYVAHLETRPRFPISRRRNNWKDENIDPIAVKLFCFMWKVAISMAWDQDRSADVWKDKHWVEVRGFTTRVNLIESLLVNGLAYTLEKRYMYDFVTIARAQRIRRARG